MVTCMKTARDTERRTKADAFSGFYLAEFSNIQRTAFVIVRDRERAREVTQEAFAKAWAK